MANTQAVESASTDEAVFLKVAREAELPAWASRATLARFFHDTMAPYNDALEDVQRGLDYAFSDAEGKGGFLMLAAVGGKLAGALLMLQTGMGGYIPENLLLFVTVDPSLRGRGLGGKIIDRAVAECRGDVKLHVEHDNPARRLYTRLGFTEKYAEMRLAR